MVACNYAEHFWGDQHIGFHVLYNALKRKEDSVQELSVFVKDRISLEEDVGRLLGKNLNKINNFITSNGSFVDAWKLSKGTLELFGDIQSTLVKNLTDLSRDIIKYHDELVKKRKNFKEQVTVDAVNLMQTTTTCLQKAKETYQQRCAELAALKKESINSKELSRVKAKLNKAHEEYKSYVEKYSTVRDDFEEKMLAVSKKFQEYDVAFLQQFKSFLVSFARILEDSQSSTSQVTTDYRQTLELTNIENIMLRFIEEKGTGTSRPQIIKWSESDEIPTEFDVQSQSAASSSNSSAVVGATENPTPDVNDLLNLDGPWGGKSTANLSDSDQESGSNANPASIMPQQFSSWLGRQKITQWRKKHSSQSNLATIAGNEGASEFSQSYNEGSNGKGNFLRRYRKSKNSISEFNSDKDSNLTPEDGTSLTSDGKQPNNFLSAFGMDEPDIDEEGFTIRKTEKNSGKSSCSSSDAEDEAEFQTSKIKSLQIRPVEQSKEKIDSSVDELRNAIGHITLHRSSTVDKDPWCAPPTTSFSQSLNTYTKPLRTAFTGDDAMNRKFSEFDYSANTMPPAAFDFSQSTSVGSSIARARPRSQTPNAQVSSGFADFNASFGGLAVSTMGRSIGSFSSLANMAGWPNDSSSVHSNSPLSFNESANSVNVTRLKIPIAMGINEHIHAWFKVQSQPKTIVRVFGTVMISFPSSFVSQLSDLQDSREPLKFCLKNANQIKAVRGNKRVITEPDPLALPQETLTFVLDRTAVAKWIAEEYREKPAANFYNIDLLHYELSDSFEAPITIKSYWKTESGQTDLRIDYSMNTSENTLTSPLINVIFETIVSGEVDSYNSEPVAKWTADKKTLSYNFTELTRHGDASGSLKARLKLNDGPSLPSNTSINFQTSNTLASQVNLFLESDSAYQLSLLRRKVLSGKYFCEPEIRN